MTIKFLGAAGTVTGSSYLLTSDSGQSILIDCGFFQGTKDLEKLNQVPLACDCSQIAGMVLTHAHLDHCGRLPLLLPQGFRKSIWMNAPTRDLTELSLLDSAKINRTNQTDHLLYDKRLVMETVNHFQIVDYGKTFAIGNFVIIMRDAGHILGSTSLEIVDASVTTGVKKIVFSGDLGNTPEDLIRATELIGSADAVVLESTYGDSTHPTDNPSDIIQKEINLVEQSGGALLIPAFSIERSQELLHRIAHLKEAGKVKAKTPVFFDSPMAQKATKVFEKYHQYYNQELLNDFQTGDPFNFPGLVTVGKKQESQGVAAISGPKVIIAGSGMMTGGRILGHAQTFLPLTSTRLLIVGYQSEGTLGRLILEGQKNLLIDRVMVIVKATISQTQAMSSHADQPKLLNWLKNIKGVKKLFLTHGEDRPRKVLAEKIRQNLAITNISLPKLNEETEIPI